MSSVVPAALLAGLNPEQVEAVTHRGSPLLVLAGPGSGKTRVLTHRIAGLVAAGTPAHRILAVTFTNKAAREMRTRLERLLPPGVEVPSSVSTFHSFCVRAIRSNADLLGLPRGFTVLDADDAIRAMRTAVEDLDKKDARALLGEISLAKNTGLSPDDFEVSGAHNASTVAAHWRSYAAVLRDMGALDFDDLLLETRRLLSTPAGDQLRTRFDSVLVDEWQDTNVVQYDIVRLLADPNPSTRDVCVVGDPNQAIYSWRGSTPEVLDRFVVDFAPCEVIALTTNYRSTPEIVALSTTIATSSGSALAKVQFHTANPSGAPVRVFAAADTEEEVDQVLRGLRRATGSRAILVRTNAQTRGFEEGLMNAGIAHQLVGATRFVDRAEVKDVLAYLRVVANPADEIAFARAAAVPRRGLGETTVAGFLSYCRDNGLHPGTAIQDPSVLAAHSGRARTALERFSIDLDRVAAQLHLGPAECVSESLDLGVRTTHSADVERLENLKELESSVLKFETRLRAEDPNLTPVELLHAYLENAALTASTDVDESADVSIITVHAAKGREFDHVWVVGVEEGIFPHQMADTRAGVDEERRLFFVATSRPRASLTISYRARRLTAKGWDYVDRSSFIDEYLTPHAILPDDSSAFTPPSFGYGNSRTNTNRTKHQTRSSKPAASHRSPSATPPPPRPQGPRLDPGSVEPGTTVQHPVFKTGTITALAGSIAVIDFGGKSRTLDLAFAPLTLV